MPGSFLIVLPYYKHLRVRNKLRFKGENPFDKMIRGKPRISYGENHVQNTGKTTLTFSLPRLK
ncbi:MAG: hypothetical protein ACK55I_38190, partial [bacterium]